MSNSNPNQIQTQIRSNLKIVEVSKKVYSVIRSVVDSSTSPIYEWNKPIVLENGKAKFVKYKVLPNNIEVKVWEIVIEPMEIQKDGAELNAILISVRDGCNRLVADLVIRTEFMAYEPKKSYTLTITKKPDNIEINADSIHEFEFYVVKPSEEIPYARPVSLSSFVNKLMLYYSKALQVVKNVDASKDDEI
jgi:hypothetical protein